MKIKNPFPYSYDNKRYHTWNYYLKNKYHNKVFKVPLNANFSCPNRDGTCGYGGCTFCGSLGSGEYAGNIHDDLNTQFEQGLKTMQNKWPSGHPIAYFQAYTNTYASLETLKAIFEPFVVRKDIVAISIATRADCLEDDKIEYLNSLCEHKEIWIELGLQSCDDTTANLIHRGHDFETFLNTMERLKDTKLKICVHLMNSLPNENKNQMLSTAKKIANLKIHAVKIHMLHVCIETKMGEDYINHPFPLLSLEDYVDITIQQLECFPPEMVIQRLTGDAVKELLIEPKWTLNKTNVLNAIDKEMVQRNTWQGKKYINKK